MKTVKIKGIYPAVTAALSEAGYRNNWVHGIPHIIRVRKNLRLLLKYSSLDNKTIKCLRIAVDMHDIGRAYPGDHANNSARIFKQMNIKGLTPEEKNDIEFTIENHSKGLKALGINKAKKNNEILLGLLCLLDHMDAIGQIGTHRTYQWLMETRPNAQILSSIPIKHLKYYLGQKTMTTEIRNLNLKSDSVLGNLIHNYLATFEIVDVVKIFLHRDFQKNIYKLNKKTFEEINYLIFLTENNAKTT